MKRRQYILATVVLLGASLVAGNLVTKYKGDYFIGQETKAHVAQLLSDKEQYLTVLNDCQRSAKINNIKKCKAVNIAAKAYSNETATYVDKRLLSYMLK